MPVELLRAGDGEVITDRTARTVVLKADHAALGMTHSRYGPGEHGPSLHVHDRHADAWWILSGELTFVYGPPADHATATVGAGGFVLMPPGLAHAFSNQGTEDVHFLNPHAPGCGFADYMRALRDGRRAAYLRFDQHDPPPDGGRPAADALIVRAGEGLALDLGPGSRSVIKAGGDDGMGSLMLAELELAPGSPGPLRHTHHELVDSFWVLEGTLDLRAGDDWVQAGPGDYAFVPPGAVHTFANRGDAPVRLLDIVAPGGLERYLIELAAELRPGTAPDPARLAEIAAGHDVQTVD